MFVWLEVELTSVVLAGAPAAAAHQVRRMLCHEPTEALAARRLCWHELHGGSGPVAASYGVVLAGYAREVQLRAMTEFPAGPRRGCGNGYSPAWQQKRTSRPPVLAGLRGIGFSVPVLPTWTTHASRRSALPRDSKCHKEVQSREAEQQSPSTNNPTQVHNTGSTDATLLHVMHLHGTLAPPSPGEPPTHTHTRTHTHELGHDAAKPSGSDPALLRQCFV